MPQVDFVIQHFDDPRDRYVVVSNALARTSAKIVSASAKAVLLYMLSHKSGFRLTQQKVAEDLEIHRHTVAAAMNCLESAGYLRRRRMTDDKGHRIADEYVVSAEARDPEPLCRKKHHKPETPASVEKTDTSPHPLSSASVEKIDTSGDPIQSYSLKKPKESVTRATDEPLDLDSPPVDPPSPSELPLPLPTMDSTEGDRAEPPKKKRTRRPLTFFPEGWKPNKRHIELCNSHEINCGILASKFESVTTNPDRPMQYRDWDLAFTRWIHNEAQWADERRRSPRPTRSPGRFEG